MVGPGAQVGSKGGFGSPKLLQVEPTHTSSKQKMLPKLSKFKQSHIQHEHQKYYKISFNINIKHIKTTQSQSKPHQNHSIPYQNHPNQIKPYQNRNQHHIRNH